MANKLSERVVGVGDTTAQLLPNVVAWEDLIEGLIKSFRENNPRQAEEHLSAMKAFANSRVLSDTLNAIFQISDNRNLEPLLKSLGSLTTGSRKVISKRCHAFRSRRYPAIEDLGTEVSKELLGQFRQCSECSLGWKGYLTVK